MIQRGNIIFSFYFFLFSELRREDSKFDLVYQNASSDGYCKFELTLFKKIPKTLSWFSVEYRDSLRIDCTRIVLRGFVIFTPKKYFNAFARVI